MAEKGRRRRKSLQVSSREHQRVSCWVAVPRNSTIRQLRVVHCLPAARHSGRRGREAAAQAANGSPTTQPNRHGAKGTGSSDD